MALNSSGPFSFGGSTTGQSINLELGVSATATASINSAAFRGLAGVPSGAISVFNFYGKSNIGYYIAILSTSSVEIVSRGGGVDSAANTYFGWDINAGDGSGYAKLNTNATSIAFQRGGNNGSTVRNFKPITRNDSTNVYLYGQYNNSNTQWWIASLNTSTGALNWQTRAQDPIFTSAVAIAWGNYLNSTGTIVFAGNYESFGTGVVQRFDSSGNRLAFWQANRNLVGISADPSENVYTFGRQITSGFGFGNFIKWSSSGAVLWNRRVSDSGSSSQNTNTGGQNPLIYSSSGHIYAAGGQNIIWKIAASDGSLVWATKVAGIGFESIDIDSSDNVYATGSISTGAGIIKLNSSGTVQWTRRFTPAATRGTYQGNWIKVYSNDLFTVGGYFDIPGVGPATIHTFVLSLPTDGSKTGTYTVGGASYTYADAGLSGAASGLTLQTGTTPNPVTSGAVVDPATAGFGTSTLYALSTTAL